jgi:glycosyltransferase involved in cell wall biosynthesis
MRIVHVVQGLGIGRQERLVIALSQELARRGHEPAIVTLSPGGDLRDEAKGLRVYLVPRTEGVSRVLRLVRLLQLERADVVHTHNPAPLLHAMPAALLARIARRVQTKHDADGYRRPAVWTARALVRTTHAVMAVSPQTADVARSKERVPERRLRVIPNGISLRPFHPDVRAGARVRAELGIAPDAFVIGSVGRLVAEKDYPLLVRSDVSRARALGEAARSHALACFSIDRMTDEYERVYRGD